MTFLTSLKNVFSSSENKATVLRNAQALETSSTCFMMADENLTIIYANGAVRELLKNLESDIQKALPHFSADKLIGQNIDIFHKDPAHQRGILANLKQQSISSIRVGRLNFQLTLNPQFDEMGKNIGTVVEWLDQTDLLVKAGMLDALDRAQAVIEFYLDGNIKSANENFLSVMGYSLDEIKNKHHSMFVTNEYKSSSEYQGFWEKLNAGEFVSGEFKRIGKGGKEVWIQASYNPILDPKGRPSSVVKFAVDITDKKLENANFSGQIEAIGKSQAVIEFTMDGIITWANSNFLDAVGYSLEEIKGQHHNMFVEAEYKNSTEYRLFWEQLNNGEFASGEYKRLGKGGKEIWIQASYNPILDMNGKPFKVVKYASEVTQQKLQNANFSGQIEAIGKSQAVIEFTMDGIILDANENFLSAVGYSISEIKGKHHSMFVEPAYRSSNEYRAFWEQLNSGEFSSGEFLRIGNGGSEIWIQASYNPIMDLNGKPYKVVKYATDITGRKRAVNEIKRVLLRLAEGDLTTKLEEEFEGEFLELGEAISEFIENLNGIILQINSSVNTITNASSEIAQGNTDLSSRTEQQASSLEETASSMEELTGTVRLNAENANQANGLASEASTVAIEGGELIQQVVETMTSINESARKIADIIGVIDGIAFQTNILALNAAVEAARAGEQGRGFAVVASEVRTLAQRSANAAKDIKELISDSVSKIENGNSLVNQSGETMTNVVTSIKRVNDIMSEIAAASAEQASGIDEIGKAITQMDEVTQQNAALVEEAAAAAESLQSQAQQLSSRVSTFVLDDPKNSAQVAPSDSKVVPSTPVKNVKPNKKVKPSTPEEDEWESF